MYAPTAPGDQWELLYEVKVTAPGSGGACTSASWHQHSNTDNSTTLGIVLETPDNNDTTAPPPPPPPTAAAVLPPMLVLGTATEGASIWMLQESIMKWKKVADLHDKTDKDSSKVVAVDWAPRLGRPHELIAVAYSNNRVALWSVKGRSDAPQIDKVAALDHEASVWQVKWNMFGNWLATSCDNGEVCMWRPDFSGEWLLLNKVVAGGDAEGEGDHQQTDGMEC
jgi:WD40 repeat protein